MYRLTQKEAEREANRIKENIDRLLQLYLETNPELGDNSEVDKFQKAVTAVTISQSPTFLSRWAEAQIIGHLTNPAIKDANSHLHEEEKAERDVFKYRNAISFILDKQSLYEDGLAQPYRWREELAVALQALNKGEVFGIIEPQKAKRRINDFTASHLRFACVLHVYRQWAILGKRCLAEEFVSKIIATSIENIKKWENNEAKELDPNRQIRNAIRNGYKIAQERDTARHNLRVSVPPIRFYSEWHKKQKDFICPELMHYDMLMIDYPLETLRNALRDVKN